MRSAAVVGAGVVGMVGWTVGWPSAAVVITALGVLAVAICTHLVQWSPQDWRERDQFVAERQHRVRELQGR